MLPVGHRGDQMEKLHALKRALDKKEKEVMRLKGKEGRNKIGRGHTLNAHNMTEAD